ncbi:aryl-alcohol dehydrogenase (NADP+) [Kutzneria kofuensis]|uniref:Aryl-alcohol dehydrogenase (NADP+) n=2 Tax=Kutzneria kofuensis TaxID=103725 RepID=A0A7W9NJU9_9PSEU|nr:aryl-alcohol dehydrogenase (NADP+) [Kutzneria kofuensis]
MRVLGGTGIKVSPYCFGAMNFGAWANSDHDEAAAIINAALDAGINFVDTADVYSAGESEEIVGKAIKGRRDDVVLATKFHGKMGEDVNHQGASRRWIMHEVENSLRRLDTDYIDVYQIHRPDPDTDIEETLSALTDLVRAGKIRAFGSSTFPAELIVEAQWASQRRGFERLRTEQPPYSVLNRTIETAVLPTTQRYSMGVLVWSPLAMGWLAGKYRNGVDMSTGRAKIVPAMYDQALPANVRKAEAVEELAKIAADAGCSLTHLAMAFSIAHPGVTSAIIGPRTREQLDDLLAGADLVLDDETLDRIDEVVAPGTAINAEDSFYTPREVSEISLRRRPVATRSAA